MATGDNTGVISEGLIGQVMRNTMENKGLLTTKGSIYAGTGTSGTVGGITIPITTAVEAPASSGLPLVSNLAEGGPNSGLNFAQLGTAGIADGAVTLEKLVIDSSVALVKNTSDWNTLVNNNFDGISTILVVGSSAPIEIATTTLPNTVFRILGIGTATLQITSQTGTIGLGWANSDRGTIQDININVELLPISSNLVILNNLIRSRNINIFGKIRCLADNLQITIASGCEDLVQLTASAWAYNPQSGVSRNVRMIGIDRGSNFTNCALDFLYSPGTSGTDATLELSGVTGCTNVNNIKVTLIDGGSSLSGYLFLNCKNLTNCYISGVSGEETDYDSVEGFNGITQATNCGLMSLGGYGIVWSGTNYNIDESTCRTAAHIASNTNLNS